MYIQIFFIIELKTCKSDDKVAFDAGRGGTREIWLPSNLMDAIIGIEHQFLKFI